MTAEFKMSAKQTLFFKVSKVIFFQFFGIIYLYFDYLSYFHGSFFSKKKVGLIQDGGRAVLFLTEANLDFFHNRRDILVKKIKNVV
jgi:hypothetical protein